LLNDPKEGLVKKWRGMSPVFEETSELTDCADDLEAVIRELDNQAEKCDDISV
jgi:hypothetical protein